jgi:hypothetical protein
MGGLESALSQLVAETVNGQHNATPGMSLLLGALKTNMDDLVKQLLSDTLVLQTRINHSVGNFSLCNDTGTYDDFYKNASDLQRANHSACRVKEAELKRILDDRHVKYDAQFPKLQPSCSKDFGTTYATPVPLNNTAPMLTCINKIDQWSKKPLVSGDCDTCIQISYSESHCKKSRVCSSAEWV